MKKLILLFVVATLTMASCEKEGTCECKTTDQKGVVENKTYHDTGKRSQLKEWCTEAIPHLLANDSTSKVECKLK